MLITMLNERRPDVKPDWHYVRIDETEHWGDCDAKRLGEKLIATYAFDKNSHTFCCCVTPSYWMVYLGTDYDTSQDLSDEDREKISDDIMESEREDSSHYRDVANVDSMNAQPLSFDVTTEIDRSDYTDDEQGDADYTRACEDYIKESFSSNPW